MLKARNYTAVFLYTKKFAHTFGKLLRFWRDQNATIFRDLSTSHENVSNLA